MNSYDWLVFTSPNGVTAFFDYFFKAFEDLRDIGGVRIAAVGPATAAKLREFHLKVDLMPEEYVAAKIADAFAKYQSIENLKILLMRAKWRTRSCPRRWKKWAPSWMTSPATKRFPETEDVNGAAAKLLESGADWITFTSSSTVENFHARFDLPALLKKFPQIKLASIGPETTKALTALQLKPTVEARQHTIEGLVKAVGRRSTAKYWKHANIITSMKDVAFGVKARPWISGTGSGGASVRH